MVYKTKYKYNKNLPPIDPRYHEEYHPELLPHDEDLHLWSFSLFQELI
jgi:hypothetical protein